MPPDAEAAEDLEVAERAAGQVGRRWRAARPAVLALGGWLRARVRHRSGSGHCSSTGPGQSRRGDAAILPHRQEKRNERGGPHDRLVGQLVTSSARSDIGRISAELPKPPHGAAMRFVLAAILLVQSHSLSVRTTTPTADEKKAIDAVEKVGGKASIDPKLSPEARVAAKFEALDRRRPHRAREAPEGRCGAIDAFDATKCTEKGFAALKELPHLRKFVLAKSDLNSIAGATPSASTRNCVTSVSWIRGLTDVELAGLKKLTLLEHLSLVGEPQDHRQGDADRQELRAAAGALPRQHRDHRQGTRRTQAASTACAR